MEIVFKFPFVRRGHSKAANGLSYVFARVRTYASNALLANPTAVMLGDIVCGVTAANYGGKGLANLGVWKLSDVHEWQRMAPETFIAPHEYDFTDWVVEWLPCLGGRGFAVDAPDENRILGVRLLPPGADPHDFVQAKRERMNKADEDAAAAGRAPPPRPARQVNFLPTSYVRPRRGRSLSRNRENSPAPAAVPKAVPKAP